MGRRASADIAEEIEAEHRVFLDWISQAASAYAKADEEEALNTRRGELWRSRGAYCELQASRCQAEIAKLMRELTNTDGFEWRSRLRRELEEEVATLGGRGEVPSDLGQRIDGFVDAGDRTWAL